MYRGFKFTFLKSLGISGEVMHLGLGLAIFLACLAVTRRPILSCLLLAVVQTLNEVIDAYEQMQRSGTFDFRETVSDSIWTLALPVAITAAICAFKSVQLWRENRRQAQP